MLRNPYHKGFVAFLGTSGPSVYSKRAETNIMDVDMKSIMRYAYTNSKPNAKKWKQYVYRKVRQRTRSEPFDL